MHKWNSRVGIVLVVVSAIFAGLTVAGAAAQEPEQANPPQNGRRMVNRAVPRRPPAVAIAEQQAARQAREERTQNNSIETAINGNTFNFKDVELYEIIEAVGALTGKNFQVDATVKGKITLITNTPIPPEMAYEVLESILQAQGFALVPSVDGNIIRVIQTRKAISSHIPTGTGPDAASIEGYERFQTQLVPIMYGDASEISQVVNSLIDQGEGNVSVYAPTNTIIITTTVSNLRRLLDIIHQIDVPGFEQKIEIITLEYARAADLAGEIQQVFGEQGAGGRPTSRPTPSVRQVRSTGTAAARARATSSIIGAEPTMRIVSDVRTNSLIIVATQGMIDEIVSLIKKLDTSTAFEEENLHVYHLLNADAKEVATILGELTSGVQPRRGGQASAAQQQAQIQPFEREVNIVAYEVTNVLLVMASPEDYTVIESIIQKLDVLPNQVWVEAVILEVTVNDGYEVGVDVSALYEDDIVAGSAFNTYASLANALIGGPAALPAGGVIGILDQDNVATIANPVTGELMEIPYTPAVITAMQTVTDVDVLSTPQLLIADNVQGSIVVGQDVPFITGSTRALGQSVGAGAYPSVYSQIRRQDVGITLNVTPQISEGEYVKLELQITNSSVAPPAPGVPDANIAGPTLSKSEIKNQIVIQDGRTAVLGGLMSRSDSKGRSKVPLLGDVPLLGFLFRRTSTQNLKRNLVVFITPTIVKTGEQMARLSEERRTTYDDSKFETLNAHNYLRRIFKKVKIKR